MASSTTSQRAVLAGLSCGIGLAAPVIAYAVTLPFEAAHEVVSAAAVPVAIGAVAGVGIHALSEVVSEASAERRREEDEAWKRSFGARSAAAPRANEAAANIYGGADYTAAIPREGIDAAEEAKPRKRVFTHIGRIKEDDIPVIARADTGHASDDPWAQIMEEEFEDSPYSCDPATSKDVYQIAIEELSHTGETGQLNGDEIAAAVRAAAGRATAPAGTTAAFIAMASAANAQAAQRAQATDTWTAAAASYAQNDAPRTEQAQWAAEAEVSAQVQLEAEEASRVNAARDAAMASLGGVRPNIETMAAPVAQQAAPAQNQAPASQGVYEIPMADYSGHEDMWAAALEILAEDEPMSAPGVVSQETRAMSADAIAERAGSPRADQAPVQTNGYEYLRVIEGGTNPFPRLAI